MTKDGKDADIEAATPLPEKAPAKVAEKASGVVPEKAPENVAEKNPGKVPETGGPKGPEPTRFGDWERNGICVDF